jgi:hypothetical protein
MALLDVNVRTDTRGGCGQVPEVWRRFVFAVLFW